MSRDYPAPFGLTARYNACSNASGASLGGTKRNAFARPKEGTVPRVLRASSTKAWAVTAVLLLLAAVSMERASAYTTTFSRHPLAGWHDRPAATRWVARDGAVRRRYVPRGYGELVRRTAFGLHDDFVVAAVIRTSPGRTNAGLTTLFMDHANHMWGKIEISPGHPRGFMSIGHRIRGRTASLLARSPVRLERGTPYRLRLAKHQNAPPSHRLDSERRTARVDRSRADRR